MFQNIIKEFEEFHNKKYIKDNKFRKIIKNNNWYLFIISFLISTVGIGTELAPFGVAILIATLSNNIPIGLMYVSIGLGTVLGFGFKEFLKFILITILFFVFVKIKKPKIEKDSNEKNRLGVYLFLACLIIQIGCMLFEDIIIYEILFSLMYSITVLIFYKIFVNAITVIKDYKYKKVFSIEEVISALLLISIAIAGAGDFSIFSFSVKNILSILLVLILGWKNGILIGSTGGVTVGIVLGIIGLEGPILVAAYGLAGMFAGVFRKFGKLGVLLGFIFGTVILTYAQNGNTIPVILIKEILIAFVGLLAVPSNININIEDILEKSKYLPTVGDRAYKTNNETVYKLNNISDTISEMAKSYKDAASIIEDEKELYLQEQRNKKIFIEELMKSLDGLEDNILFDDLYGVDTKIVDEIFITLIKKDKIKRQDILDIFEKNNNYLIGIETENKSGKMNQDIEEIVKIINTAYRLSKINFIWKKKLDESKKIVSNQLEEVSKAISSMAETISSDNKIHKNEDIEKEIKILLEQKQIILRDILIKKSTNGKFTITVYTDSCQNVDNLNCKMKNIKKIIENVIEQKVVLQKQVCGSREKQESCMHIFTSQDKFMIQVGISNVTKSSSLISGDSVANMKLDDGKYLVALSDGMGTGEEAKKSSNLAIVMLEKMLSSGFEKETSIKLINSILSSNTAEEMYATLDISILDLFEGNLEFIKNGACPTYIKNKNKVELLKSIALPAGILSDLELAVYEKSLNDGDIIVMCSDGILDSNKEYTNKEVWVQYLLEEIKSEDAQKIADIVLNEAIDNDFGIEKDDMTVIVVKVSVAKC